MAQKWEATAFKNPLSRARGLGSAHSGVHHWLHQKITALANIPLVLWAIWSVTTLAATGASREVVWAFFRDPVHAVLMVLFLISTLYHMALGLQVVIEDYMHCEKAKMMSLILMRLAVLGLAVTSIFSVLKMAF
jgi:succinate dehydrogenase / fumarate reductase membrane anchor subunit